MWFDDDGHYADVDWNFGDGGCSGSGAEGIPSRAGSFVDDAGRYDVVIFNQPTNDNSMGEHRPRSSGVYSYASVLASVPTDRSGLHSYLEIIGYSETNNHDDPGTTAENYYGPDPVEVEGYTGLKVGRYGAVWHTA